MGKNTVKILYSLQRIFNRSISNDVKTKRKRVNRFELIEDKLSQFWKCKENFKNCSITNNRHQTEPRKLNQHGKTRLPRNDFERWFCSISWPKVPKTSFWQKLCSFSLLLFSLWRKRVVPPCPFRALSLRLSISLELSLSLSVAKFSPLLSNGREVDRRRRPRLNGDTHSFFEWRGRIRKRSNSRSKKLRNEVGRLKFPNRNTENKEYRSGGVHLTGCDSYTTSQRHTAWAKATIKKKLAVKRSNHWLELVFCFYGKLNYSSLLVENINYRN